MNDLKTNIAAERIARAAGVPLDELRASMSNALEHALSSGMTDEDFVLWIWHAGFIAARDRQPTPAQRSTLPERFQDPEALARFVIENEWALDSEVNPSGRADWQETLHRVFDCWDADTPEDIASAIAAAVRLDRSFRAPQQESSPVLGRSEDPDDYAPASASPDEWALLAVAVRKRNLGEDPDAVRVAQTRIQEQISRRAKKS